MAQMLPKLDQEEGVGPVPMEDDVIMSSNPASPASPSAEVPSPSPSPMLSMGAGPHHSGPVTPMPLFPHILFAGAASATPQIAPSSEPVPQRGVATSHAPLYRTDPGAPPGCSEHSLNILGGRYLLLDQLEGSHLQRCIDVTTKQEFVCKVRTEKRE